MKISSELAEILYLDEGSAEGWTYVTKQHEGNSRWYGTYSVIIRETITGMHFAFKVKRGLTEYQDSEYPWDDSSEVELTPVYPVKVTTTVYRTSPN